MITLIVLLLMLKGSKGAGLIAKIIGVTIAVIIDTFIIMSMILIGSGIHWLFS